MLLCYFNSIKVRLEPSAGSAVEGASDRFQFHKGTIRTSRKTSNLMPSLNFNSIKVRLELLNQLAKFSEFQISIP